MRYGIVGIGCSLGGLQALSRLLRPLPPDFPLPIVVVQHRAASSDDANLERYFEDHCSLPVVGVEDKDPIEPGHVYFAPADYHLLVEEGTFALSVDDRVQYSRPSVDVLFGSLADVYGPGAIGVILTGTNMDGAQGLLELKRAGGYAIVQDPRDSAASSMPAAAIAAGAATQIVPLDEIAPLLTKLAGES